MWDLAAPMALLLLPLPLLASRLLPPARSNTGALRVPPFIAARLQPARPLLTGSSGGAVLAWLTWFGLVVAVADPRTALSTQALAVSGRDIILALDLSGSMTRTDFTVDQRPARRLDAMKQVAKAFIRRRVGDRIGLVVFAEQAYVAAAPSFDLAAVSQALDEVEVGLVGRSTAIGDGLGLALKRLSESKAASRVVILLSDGANNAGTTYPLPVGRLAKSLGIRVHTIALGLHDLKTPEGDPDAVDTETLKAVAEESGGTAFRVRSTEDLEQVSQAIEQLESGRELAPPAVIRKDLWMYPAGLALFAATLSLVLGRTNA
jgi:Ca-activated chloride channel homolog